MKALKAMLFAGVFALAAIFTVNANAAKKTSDFNCWTDKSKVGQQGMENQSTDNCPGQRTICCYTVNPSDPDNPIEFYLLPLQ